MKLDLNNLPIMINSNQFQSDISTFLGNFYNYLRYSSCYMIGWKNDKK